MLNVSDSSSHRRDQIANFAEILRNSPARQKIFESVYRGKQKIKTIGEIAKATGYKPKRVAEIAGPLGRKHLFHQTRGRDRGKSTTVYQKIDTVAAERDKILSLARDKRRLDSYHTKTNPKVSVKAVVGTRVTVKVPFRVRVEYIKLEEIEEFKKTKTIKPLSVNDRLPERRVKEGILKLLGETKYPKDWGGENNDTFTDRITIKGKKHRAAFALKGPAKKGPLVPKMMGANGDQIQRLFDSPASVFVVQYEGEIKESIYKLMEELAKAKAITGGIIYWCVIDDDGTKRLRAAYPRAFKK